MKWVKHDTDANQDAKLQNVLLDYGLEGYGLYWYCIELIAGKVDKENITFELEHDARIIARNTGSSAQKISEIMKYFVNQGLFENTSGVVTCLKLARRLDKSMTSNPEMRNIIEGLNANKTQLDGYVYFIEKRDSGNKVIAVKIGRSKNPKSRLNEISKADENIGFTLEIIHKIKSENCVSLETELHRKLSKHCIHNEWFSPVNDVYEVIKASKESLRHDYDMITSDYVMQEETRLEETRLEEIKDMPPQQVETPLPKVPYSKILDLYHSTLPNHPQIKVLSEKRKAHIRQTWRNYLNTLDDWEEYFRVGVSKNDFLSGKSVPINGRKPWMADFDWLINQNNAIKVSEGKYNEQI